MQKQFKNRQDKLSVLQNILNGTFSLDLLQAPKDYCVLHNGTHYEVEGILMNETEFEVWQQNLQHWSHLQGIV